MTDEPAPNIKSLKALRAAEAECRRCPLYRNAKQVVPGEGPAHARMMLVGEQPGDQEDKQGRPFVGPAGGMLAKALDDAGIDRDEVFVTNAVKHFKFEPRGKRRLHKKPNAHEIDRCHWWLMPLTYGGRMVATIHPSYILRVRDDDDRAALYAGFVADLRTCKKALARAP